MDDHLRWRILEMSRTLAVEEKERLEAAGTFVDLERLTMEIGDELARQLAGLTLSSRTEKAFEQKAHYCPDCGKECDVEAEPEPLISPRRVTGGDLQGMRGEIEYSEPRCHCSRCRRAFFPSGQGSAAPAP